MHANSNSRRASRADAARLFNSFVRVHASSSLLSQSSSRDQFAKGGRRPVLSVAEILQQDIHHGQAHVETNQVRQCEGAYWMVRPELHSLVNFFRRCHSLAEQKKCLVYHRNEQPIYDEARGVANYDGRLS